MFQGDIINVLEEITADKLDLKSNDEVCINILFYGNLFIFKQFNFNYLLILQSCLINDDELNKYSVTETEFENYSGNGLNFDDTTEKSVEVVKINFDVTFFCNNN